MSLADRALLQNILDEADFILTYTAGKPKEEISSDPVLSRAIIRSLEIIGEASRKLAPAFKTLHPEIEWKKIAGTRDRLIHDYQGIDYDIVWNIIEEKLPLLRQQINSILSQ
jgi:uncharacterized protein with HEPN domain